MCTDGHCGRVTKTDDELCMGWGEAAALIGAATSAGGAAAAANATSNAASSNNSANMEVAAIGNLINISEAEKSRLFNSREAEYAFTRSQQAAAEQRGWSAEQQERSQIYNTREQGIARDFNASEAEKSRQFEQYMSNTQYQRAVGDMQQAGLNPMLAYSQGGAGNVKGAQASTGAASSGPPSGSSAQSAQASSGASATANVPNLQNPGPGGIGSIGAATAIANQIADLRSKDAATKLTEAQASKTEGEIPHGALTTQKLQDEVNILKNTFINRVKGVKSDQDTKYNQADITHLQRSITEAELQHAKGSLTTQQLQQEYMRANNQLTRLGIPGAEAEAKFATQTGVAPMYSKWLSTTLSGAGSLVRATRGGGNNNYSETYYGSDGGITGGRSRNYQGAK